MAGKVRIRLSGCPGAPRQPGRVGLVRLFQRAWHATSGRVRPAVPSGLDLAVDLRWVTDREIAELHRRHFGKREATDVVSFPMLDFDPESRSFLLGEIAVSIDTARRESQARALPYAEELSRYALHGFLHLMGYCDETLRERRAMTAHQERILSAHLR
jgi:probable rRNA maturation factor